MQLARTVGAVLGVTAAIVSTGLFSVVPASAHTPTVWAKCVDEKAVLHVDLKAYNTKKGDNKVTVSLDGEELESTSFKEEFAKQYDGGDATTAHSFKVVVKASDNEKYSFTKGDNGELDVPACVDKKVETTTPTTVAPPAETTTTTAPVTTTVATSPAAPATTTAVAVAEGGLANTGASIAIPLVIGLVLLGGGVAVLIVLRRRAKA